MAVSRHEIFVIEFAGSPRQRLPLVLILIFVLLSAGIVSAGYLYYHGGETSQRQEVEKQLIAVGDLKVAELAQWRKERLSDGGIFFRNTAFSALVGRYFYRPDDLEAQRELESWLSKVLAYEQYDRAFLLDPQGIERLSLPLRPERIASVISQRTPEILETGAVVFQDFFRDDQDQRVYMAVLVPILDLPDGGPPLGMLVLRIDPEQYLYPFINRWPTPSPTAETLLVRRDGSDVLYLNELRFRKDTALILRYPLDRQELPAVKVVLGEKGIVDGADYRGVSVIADLQAIPNSPWFLVARIDAAEAFGPLVAQLWVMIFLVAALLFCSGAGVGFVWRQQNTRFYRERFQASEALRQSEASLQRAEAIGHLGHWRLDLANEQLSWSEEMYRLYGIRPEDFTFNYAVFTRLVHPEDRDDFDQTTLAIQKEGTAPFSYRIVRADGEIRHLSGTGELERDPSGKAVGMFGTVQDVTGLHQKERELQEKNAELERFTYTISHDLKSPLVTVKTFLGYLKEDLGNSEGERVEQDMGYIHGAADKMAQLLDELLEMSRIGRVVNPPVRVELGELAQEALNLVAGRISEGGVQVQVDNQAVVLIGDRPRLVEIWQNLVENAVKFVGNQPSPRIEIGADRRGQETLFYVRDNGLGIDTRFQERVFNLFEKLDPRIEGAGLGLAMVKRIVELYGGKIWLESKGLGKGSCFWFTLPQAVLQAKEGVPK